MKKEAKRELGTIRQSVFIAAPPEKVFEAFTDPKIHSKFTGGKATGAPKVGAKITAWDGYIWGKNRKLQKGKLIVQDWMTSEFPRGYGYSELKISLKKKGEGTQLTMVHSKVPKKKMKDFASGWQSYYWKGLKKYFKDN